MGPQKVATNLGLSEESSCELMKSLFRLCQGILYLQSCQRDRPLLPVTAGCLRARGNHPAAASQAGPLLAPRPPSTLWVEGRTPHPLWLNIVLSLQILTGFLMKTAGTVSCFGLVGFVLQILCL